MIHLEFVDVGKRVNRGKTFAFLGIDLFRGNEGHPLAHLRGLFLELLFVEQLKAFASIPLAAKPRRHLLHAGHCLLAHQQRLFHRAAAVRLEFDHLLDLQAAAETEPGEGGEKKAGQALHGRESSHAPSLAQAVFLRLSSGEFSARQPGDPRG